MALPSVQFYGANNVIEAATNRDCPNWAIFQGKQFLFKYEGGDMAEGIELLEKILNSMRQSTAIYTICFYEEAEKIKANTPYDGSFNFRLVTEQEREERHNQYSGTRNLILEKLESIEQRLQTVEADEDEDDSNEMGGIGGMLMGLIQEPEKLATLISIGKNLLGMGNTQQQAARVAGIDVTSLEGERIHNAVEILKKNDPKIAEHLTKLANMSEKDPATFNYLLKMLDNL